jgi:hypothetical protein
MRWWRTPEHAAELAAQDDFHRVLALEDNAIRAGAALACSYANSREYEAELIAARRAAGVYGPRRGHAWWLRIAAVGAGLAAVVILIVLLA